MNKRLLSIAIAMFVFGVITVYLLSTGKRNQKKEDECNKLLPDTTNIVNVGEEFCIVLSYPSGTNYYDYTTEYNKEQIEFISNEKRNSKEDCDGCVIIETYKFRAKKEAKTFVVIKDVSEGMQRGVKTDTAGFRNDTQLFNIEIIR